MNKIKFLPIKHRLNVPDRLEIRRGRLIDIQTGKPPKFDFPDGKVKLIPRTTMIFYADCAEQIGCMIQQLSRFKEG
jgi:hypothetical protein